MLLRLHLSVASVVGVIPLALSCSGSGANQGEVAASRSVEPPAAPSEHADAALTDAGLARVATGAPVMSMQPDASGASDASAESGLANPSMLPNEPDTEPAPDAGPAGDEEIARDGPVCMRDGDCKAVDATCEVCLCLALPVAMSAPVCKGERVTCVEDPCESKRPVCRAGACALMDQSPSTF